MFPQLMDACVVLGHMVEYGTILLNEMTESAKEWPQAGVRLLALGQLRK